MEKLFTRSFMDKFVASCTKVAGTIHHHRPLLMLMSVLTAGWVSPTIRAQEFAALVTPPRYEISMQPGQTSRQILEITHMGTRVTPYRIYTADWTYSPEGTVNFYEPLQPGSCRQWVALERREISLASQAKKRFRFEISTPADAAAGECRFAVMIEGRDLKVKASEAVSFPMAARIGVVVYVTIGKGAPVLEFGQMSAELIDGKITPVLQVRNTGNAHGRLSGVLDATDAAGVKFELSPATLPILPGETRKIVLAASPDDKIAQGARYPLKITGNLEWADQKTPISHLFVAPASPAITTLVPNKVEAAPHRAH